MFVDKDQPFLSVEREVIIFIIRQINKMTEIVYVYEAKSYWDNYKKQPRN